MRVRLAIFTGVAAISFAAIFFRLTAPTPPLVAAGLRLLLAAGLLAPLALRARRLGRLDDRALRFGLLAGVFYALHFGSWVTSLALTSVAASVTLVTATPLLLALVAAFTRTDRATSRQWLAIALALVGLSFIGGADLATEGALVGDGLAFAGAAAMAGYLLVVRRLGADVDAWAFTGVACAVGGALLMLTAVVLGMPLWPPTTEAGVYVVLAALLPQLVGHGALTWSLRHVSPTTVGMATVGEPVGSTLLAYLWLREDPSWVTLVGCAITLAAVLFSFSRRRP